MTSVTPVILCGGSGTRLWPLSRSGFPKQFLVLSGGDSKHSLFQEAIERINAIANPEIALNSILIVTNEEHRFLALDQLRELPNIQASLLLEPIGRNTAPALSLAAFQARDSGSNLELDPILVITPADQTVQNTAAFVRALQDCVAIVDADELFFRHSLLVLYFLASSKTRSLVQYPLGLMALGICAVNSASQPFLLAAPYEPLPSFDHSVMVLYISEYPAIPFQSLQIFGLLYLHMPQYLPSLHLLKQRLCVFLP